MTVREQLLLLPDIPQHLSLRNASQALWQSSGFFSYVDSITLCENTDTVIPVKTEIQNEINHCGHSKSSARTSGWTI